MSEYSDHNSIYENSDYPSRRQAPGRERQSAGSGGSKKHRRWKRRNPVLHVLGILFKVLGTLLLIGLCTGAIMACFAAVYINEVIVPIADLSMDDFPLGENSIMYYKDKATGEYREMTTLLNMTSQIWVDYEDMPEYLKQAAVAIEDKRFWTHPGVDWRGTGKAVLSMFTGGDVSGGSTITQQLLKNMTNYDEVTVKRKIIEIVRALRFTQNNSKDATLERYLNIIPLGNKYGGGGSYEGVGAAALGYFGKPVSELTLAECASLISITNNPSKYGPYSFAKSQGKNTEEIWDARRWNKYRQEVVLQCMLEQEMISQEEHDAAVAQELVFVKDQSTDGGGEIYTWYEETVRSDVKEALSEAYGWSEKQTNQALARGGLRIYTCFDPDAQAIVDEIYTNRDNLNYTSKDGQLMQSAIAVIDNESHNLVAIAGQFGEKTKNLLGNYANDGHRPSGSSIKPLSAYSPAIEFGKITPYSVVDDYPYQMMGGRAWPVNSGTAHYRGRTVIYDALRRSVNTIAVRLVGDMVTPEESFKFVQDRYHIDLEPGRMVGNEWKTDIGIASLALGGLTNGTNVRDMAEAYSVFPNGGYYNSSLTFTRVTQMVDGKEIPLLEIVPEEEQVIKETTAWYMNEMLQGVWNGTGGRNNIKGQHSAGKTGTTSDDFDRWFAGYTPYYTAVVWTGYERNQKMITRNYENPALTLWNKVMTRLHEGLPDKNFPDPGGRRTITYCLDSGMPAGPYCALDPRGSRVASGSIFPGDYPEGQACTFHQAESAVTVCLDCPVLKEDGTPTGLYHQAGEFCPEDRRQEICYPNFVRELVGSATADDEMWRFENVSVYGPCTVHTTEPIVDPVDPNNPFDPNNPWGPSDPNQPVDPSNPNQPADPNDPNQPTDPSNPDPPVDPNNPGSVLPDVPVLPPDPLLPSDDMVG
ncbi:penicillin-binding protein [Colidextribacter sp. OB.20]|uniref:transglycosylase domain-containing protein n=1 Tax=Colidextribacter sp. OB.20 TaxID=2304568 RepID=UPI00136B7203|nr:transglycosylase domain-containing protein [Colidextribacter sp. OB.20]NBI09584.1 penicillin-binding protein [Colidextribacter sp. OB.20]